MPSDELLKEFDRLAITLEEAARRMALAVTHTDCGDAFRQIAKARANLYQWVCEHTTPTIH